MANVVSVVFAAPLAAGLMSITALGLAGWQWLFILEGIPSVLLGAVMLVSPSTAVTIECILVSAIATAVLCCCFVRNPGCQPLSDDSDTRSYSVKRGTHVHSLCKRWSTRDTDVRHMPVSHVC
jgi:MFS family permease